MRSCFAIIAAINGIKRRCVAVLFFAASVATAFGDIDFTPRIGYRTLEGAKFSQLFFRQNGQNISYEQPRGWSYSGNASRITFTPPDVALAIAEIGQVALTNPEIWDEDTINRLQNQAVTLVPPDSQGVALVSAEKNPLMISGRETLEVIIAYELYSEAYLQSVLFLDVDDTQLRCRFVSRKRDFPKLHQTFRASLCSLEWLRSLTGG